MAWVTESKFSEGNFKLKKRLQIPKLKQTNYTFIFCLQLQSYMRREQPEKQNKRQNSTSNLQKIVKFLYTTFCGDPELDPVINRSIVFNTYMQIAEFIYILSLYSWFNKTNNSIYHAVQGTFSGFSIVACMMPRLIANKHYSLLITLIVFIFITVGSLASTILLFKNYFTFKNYCNILNSYSIQNSSFDFQAASICANVTKFYWMVLAANAIISVLRIAYLYFLIKAYEVAKKIFNEEEQKRRRKEKFDLNRKIKNPYNAIRKI